MELVRRYVDEVYNAHNPAAADAFLAEDFNLTTRLDRTRTSPATPMTWPVCSGAWMSSPISPARSTPSSPQVIRWPRW